MHADDDLQRVHETTISLDDTEAHWCMGGKSRRSLGRGENLKKLRRGTRDGWTIVIMFLPAPSVAILLVDTEYSR